VGDSRRPLEERPASAPAARGRPTDESGFPCYSLRRFLPPRPAPSRPTGYGVGAQADGRVHAFTLGTGLGRVGVRPCSSSRARRSARAMG